MCARFSLAHPERVARALPGRRLPPTPPRFNIAPTERVLVAANDRPHEFVRMRWGLIPSWAADRSVGPRMINARAESVAEQRAFRSALRHRRAVVFADGYFEWRATAAGKEPIYFTLRDGAPMGFAGLWESWAGSYEEPLDVPLESVTIITTAASDLAARVHDRMPAILAADAWERWLDPRERSADVSLRDITPFDAALMQAHVVARVVNRVGNDLPACIEPLAAFA